MLSMKAKYAIKSLVKMAKNKDTLLQSKEIAKAENLPSKFLESILSDLKKYGFIKSKRGAQGGYYLATEPKNIMMGDVLRKIDGPLAPIRCASVTYYLACDDCLDEKKCSIRNIMFDVRNAISEVLDKRSLEDML